MASNLKLSNNSVNTQADAFAALFNSGFLRIYNGTQPATADTNITTQTLLAELTFGNPAFPAAAAGVITANAMIKDSSANATGVAAWFRCIKADGSTKLFDGSVGTSNSDIVLNNVNIMIGLEVSITAFSHTIPKSA